MNIGTQIKNTRKSKSIRQDQLCGAVGISQSYLSLVENNKRKPSQDVLESICKCLGTHAGVLYWKSIDLEDVKESKRHAFKILKSSVDRFLEEFIVSENSL